MGGGSFLALLFLPISVGAQTTTLNFDELSANFVIGNHYQAKGIVFDNAQVDGRGIIEVSPPNAITTIGNIGDATPLTFRFPLGVSRVGIQCDADGFVSDRQPELRVFDQNGNLLGSQNCLGPLTILSISAPSGKLIYKGEVGSVIFARDDQFLSSDSWDNLNFDLPSGSTLFLVDSALFFNPTGILVRSGQTLRVTGSGTVDISRFNGSYIVDPNGTIVIAPPAGSGAFDFFRDGAAPAGVDPVVGTTKTIISGGHLDGAPYGALVAGFSPTQTPTSFSDFPSGFLLVGASKVITAPSPGGYLFLAVNDIDNTYDNSGAFTVVVSTTSGGGGSACGATDVTNQVTIRRLPIFGAPPLRWHFD